MDKMLQRGVGALLFACCGAACGSAEPASEGPKVASTARTQPPLDLSKEMNIARKVRKLEVRGTVPLRELDEAGIESELKTAIARDVPEARLVGESLFLKILGLVPPDFDYAKATIDMMKTGLAGFYDTHSRSMVLSRALPPEFRKEALVHELVHALQDQHFGLGAALDAAREDSDRASALHALAEGDATSAMLDATLAPQGHTSTELGDDILIDRMREGFRAAAPNVPGVLKRSALAPYADGLLFVNELRRSGGWELVNEAWARPPASTEQLLHMEKYASKEGFKRLNAAPAPKAQCQARLSETIGEQGIRIVLEEWQRADDAAAAAAGWNGDLAQVFECGKQHALIWRIAFDDVEQAAAGVEALKSGLGTCRPEHPLGVRTVRLVGETAVVGAMVGPGATCEQLSDWVRVSS